MPSPDQKPLETYRSKRDFRRTPEPSSRGRRRWKRAGPMFVVQQHQARTMHFDFRLEVDGVLKSWAVPKGPSTDPREKRLAVEVGDHPLDYADFEGVIPHGDYGAGAVIVWDAGPFRNLRHDDEGNPIPMAQALEEGLVEVWLEGKKIRGGFALVHSQMRGNPASWLLIKMKDEGADARRKPTKTEPESILSGRTVAELAAEEGRIQDGK